MSCRSKSKVNNDSCDNGYRNGGDANGGGSGCGCGDDEIERTAHFIREIVIKTQM